MSNDTGRPLPSPHAHAPISVQRMMLTVAAALLPATLFGIVQFGWPAFNLVVITLTATVLTEALAVRLAGRPVAPALRDGSALLTGLILALTLPPWAPWWIGVVGGAFAALVGKQVFGGIGQNLFNPAMVGRVALLIAFPLEMTTWVAPQPLFSAGAPGFLEGLAITFGAAPPLDAITAASVLDQVRNDLARELPLAVALEGFNAPAAALGSVRGSLGETSALLIAAGGLFLIARRIITWHIPVAMLGTVALLAALTHMLAPDRFAGAAFHLLTGGLMLGAFFIATDPVGAPATPAGRLLFGAGCGALVFIIRTWGSFPEGVAFAVLLMNSATPVIDHYIRPRIYGRRRDGRPLPLGEEPRS